MFRSDYKRLEWEAYHYRFGLAGEGQADRIARRLDLHPGVVANVGCGPSQQKLAALAAHSQKLIAVDHSHAMLVGARGSGHPDRVTLVTADAYHLPLRDESVDHVVALGLFAYIRDDHAALRELRRVCRTGGFIMLTDSVVRDPQRFRAAQQVVPLCIMEESEAFCPAASGDEKRRYFVAYQKLPG